MAKAKSNGSQCELSTKQQADFFRLCCKQHSFDDQADIVYWQEIQKCINKETWTRVSRETEGNIFKGVGGVEVGYLIPSLKPTLT